MMIAHERFLESSRSDALFDDPFAKAMASDKGEALSANFGANCAIFNLTDWPEFHKVWTSVRTKFINDTVLALSSTGGFRSLVNLGAGYDTRAFHLKCYENFTNGAYEVDMAIVNEQKVTILREFLGSPTPLCPTNNVNLDFLSETSLAKALGETSFDASKPAIFLSEGLIMYLGEVGKHKLIREFSEVAAPGSKLILQFMEDEKNNSPHALSQEDCSAALTEGGWDGIEYFRFGDSTLNYNRFPTERFGPQSAFSFCTASKK